MQNIECKKCVEKLHHVPDVTVRFNVAEAKCKCKKCAVPVLTNCRTTSATEILQKKINQAEIQNEKNYASAKLLNGFSVCLLKTVNATQFIVLWSSYDPFSKQTV